MTQIRIETQTAPGVPVTPPRGRVAYVDGPPVCARCNSRKRVSTGWWVYRAQSGAELHLCGACRHVLGEVVR